MQVTFNTIQVTLKAMQVVLIILRIAEITLITWYHMKFVIYVSTFIVATILAQCVCPIFKGKLTNGYMAPPICSITLIGIGEP